MKIVVSAWNHLLENSYKIKDDYKWMSKIKLGQRSDLDGFCQVLRNNGDGERLGCTRVGETPCRHSPVKYECK